ncbi:hypothetical protein AVEN_9706-1 [Araneus ventricosus]|uniref:Uncharacterized protein n=1 Tax=Araneus ventricosus TaxID=182803 RepID=A0A4Y2DVY0_ARAVE|nr:hypothetical protein AVEN_9706-1 [Araneus ventricosus]
MRRTPARRHVPSSAIELLTSQCHHQCSTRRSENLLACTATSHLRARDAIPAGSLHREVDAEIDNSQRIFINIFEQKRMIIQIYTLIKSTKYLHMYKKFIVLIIVLSHKGFHTWSMLTDSDMVES